MIVLLRHSGNLLVAIDKILLIDISPPVMKNNVKMKIFLRSILPCPSSFIILKLS